ncbi:MAG TPA: addiction module protein [Bryobacteraceae bacterium]|nr:addiction module protein [Bryobacteraceae bacterium]
MGTVDIASLSTEERLRLLEELWESLRETPQGIPLTNAQREELDRRLDELDRDGPTGIPWEEVFRNIRNRGQ